MDTPTTAKRTQANRQPAAPYSPANNRSKITNGGALFAGATVDGRRSWSRRMRDLLALHISDAGGEDAVSAAEHSIIRRIAAVTIELELLEQRFATSESGATAVDLDLYLRAANSLRRMLEAVGLKRVARDVTPMLQDYLNRPAFAEDPADVELDEASP